MRKSNSHLTDVRSLIATFTLLLILPALLLATIVPTKAGESQLSIGDTGPSGGLIFYIDGDTYYEAAPAGWSGNGDNVSQQWGCWGQTVPGTQQAIGTGAANTATIIAYHDDTSNFNGENYYTYSGNYEDIGCQSSNNGTVAAKYVDSLTINGFDDWFLPSFGELTAMYQNLYLNSLGDFHESPFADGNFWSSSEVTIFFAGRIHFESGGGASIHKITNASLRPARSFDHYSVSNVPEGLVVYNAGTGQNIVSGEGNTSNSTPTIRIETEDGIPIALFQANLEGDASNRDFSGILANVNPQDYKSVVHGLDSLETIGTHSLYIPKGEDHDHVTICPEATELAEVTTDCTEASVHTEEDSDTTVVTINEQDYWLVEGLSGTGGVSALTESEETTEGNGAVPGLPNTGSGLTSQLNYGSLALSLVLAAALGVCYKFRHKLLVIVK